MCGIVGALYKTAQIESEPSQRLVAALELLHHRGPDGKGVWVSPSRMSYLGHTRLAIIDTSPRGAQPKLSHDGQFVAVFNGEIYNYRELRAELEKGGVQFFSDTDTEVAIEGYRAWGANCLNQFKGMFAIAILDIRKDEVLIARDPLGKKPLLYSEMESGVAFASELPPLARFLKREELAYDLDALASMLIGHMRHVPDPYTGVRGVRRLLAGHAMIVTAGKISKMWRYWSPNVSFFQNTTSERVRELLEIAVERRLRSDVPLSVLLSGGVDSTAIAAVAQSRSPSPLLTFAYGAGREDPDILRARFAAKALGTEHTEVFCAEAPSWKLFVQMMQQYGDPIALLPLLHAAELSERIRSQGVKVVLSGNGADEIFYGYTGFHRLGLYSRLESIVPRWALSLLGPKFGALACEPGRRKAALYRVWAEEQWPSVLANDGETWLQNRASEMARFWGEALLSHHYIDESAFVGLMVENTHSVTTIGDLSGMMHGVEIRSPFLDVDLVECALQTHFTQKVGLGRGPHNLKALLRSAVEDIVPQELLLASKRGFGMSIQERDLLRGPWRVEAGRYLEDSDTLGGLLDAVKIRHLWGAFLSGKHENASLLTRVLALQVWSREVFGALKGEELINGAITDLRAGMAEVS